MAESSKKNITSQMENLTPEIASTLLESMIGNRPVSQRRVEQMAADIKAGKWAENGESVIIDNSGRLIDGQHRCWAVVEANRGIRTVMVRGVHADTFASIDQGRYRSDADILAIAHKGIASPKTLATALRLVMWWEGDYSFARKAFNTHDKGRLLAVHERHSAIESAVAFCGGARFRGLLRPGVAAFAIHMGRRFGAQHDPDAFWLSVSTGAGLTTGEPALTLREYVRRRHTAEVRIHTTSAGFSAYNEVDACLRAWNAHCEGVPLEKMMLGEETAQPYGAPAYKASMHTPFAGKMYKKHAASRHNAKQFAKKASANGLRVTATRS